MYIRKIYRFRNAIEIEEHATGLFGAPGLRRKKKNEPTPEQVQARNQRLKTTRCRRKLRAHFVKNDYMVTLTYKKEQRPADMQEAKADLTRFLRRLRKFYAAKGRRLKWIANIEVGTKGAWHAHMVINRAPDADVAIREAWQHGRVSFQLLHEHGEYRDLAAYMTKTPLTDKRLKEACYKCARGLEIPEPEEIRHRGRFAPLDQVGPPPGWYVDPESLVEGENLVTGTPFRQFTLLRTDRGGDK